MTLRERLLDGRRVIGTWLQTGSAVCAEILAASGFDFIAADMEHTGMDTEAFMQFARAVGEAAAPMARVCANDPIAIRRVLDGGAQGVIVPLVNTRQEAERAVAAAKYPPKGVRGYAFVRANAWGADFDAYARQANDQVAVIVMIETKKAVENLEDIVRTEGVDGVLIGPYDLSGSYGVPGQTEHPLVCAAKQAVLACCLKHGKAAGQHIVLATRENVAKALAEGYRFLPLGMDTVFVAQGARAVRALADAAE